MSTETVPAPTCRICGEATLDDAWEALAGGNPGPAMLEIGRLRHAHTGLDLMGKGARDDIGVIRCVTCLRVVPEDKSVGRDFGSLIQLEHPYMRTGYELLCCGFDDRPPRDDDGEE